jgi:TonB family protein
MRSAPTVGRNPSAAAGASTGTPTGAASHPRTIWLATAGLSLLLHGFGIVIGGALISRSGHDRPGLGADFAGFRLEDGLPKIGLDVDVDVDVDIGLDLASLVKVVDDEPGNLDVSPGVAPAREPPRTQTSLAPLATPPLAPAPPEPKVPSVRGDQRHLTNRPAPLNPLPGPPPVPSRLPASAQVASDRGSGRGTRLDAWAFRRDTSTAHERLSDGADTYQPPHDRTAPDPHPASPQAVRRERETGEGDSTHTSFPQAPSPAPNYATADPEPTSGAEARSSQTAEADPNDTSPNVAPDRQAPIGPRLASLESTGPLDADHGPRAFDVATRGATAADSLAVRAASDELHPSITDLSRAAAAGDADLGRGPGLEPGGSPLASRGLAAAVSRPHGVAAGTGDEDSLRARTYNRYELELRRRVHDAYAFPKDLALRMEQGETIVRFTVAPDGRLSGSAQVVKSSGFDGFDQAALDAVARALPFRPMPDAARATARPLVFSVWFRAANPVVP